MEIIIIKNYNPGQKKEVKVFPIIFYNFIGNN